MPPPRQSLLDSANLDVPSLPPAADLVAALVLTEDRALTLIGRLADHFGIAVAHWSRWDIEMRLIANAGDHGGFRHLTTAEWCRVIRTPAWRAVTAIAYDNVADSDILALAVRQAGLECAECGAALPADADTAQTWGRCNRCRTHTTVADILSHPCVADAAGHHDHHCGHCEHCGVPMPHHGQQPSPAALRGQPEPSVHHLRVDHEP